jgi:cbb3-type cytochrome oxidase subunit 3
MRFVRCKNSFDAERRLAPDYQAIVSAYRTSKNSFDAERRLAHLSSSQMWLSPRGKNSFDAERRLALLKVKDWLSSFQTVKIPSMPKGV